MFDAKVQHSSSIVKMILHNEKGFRLKIFRLLACFVERRGGMNGMQGINDPRINHNAEGWQTGEHQPTHRSQRQTIHRALENQEPLREERLAEERPGKVIFTYWAKHAMTPV
ncbi:MAG TPA: hypothetical protein PK916_16815 [Bacteroidota bacterium]|nr:hypothetical protein [Bacteroidota bacterium]